MQSKKCLWQCWPGRFVAGSSRASRCGRSRSTCQRQGYHGYVDLQNGLPGPHRHARLHHWSGNSHAGKQNASSGVSVRFNDFVFVKSRFLLRKSNDSTDTTVYQWWVPLTWTNGNSIRQRDWLSVDEVTKTISSLATGVNQWVVFNVDQESQMPKKQEEKSLR